MECGCDNRRFLPRSTSASSYVLCGMTGNLAKAVSHSDARGRQDGLERWWRLCAYYALVCGPGLVCARCKACISECRPPRDPWGENITTCTVFFRARTPRTITPTSTPAHVDGAWQWRPSSFDCRAPLVTARESPNRCQRRYARTLSAPGVLGAGDATGRHISPKDGRGSAAHHQRDTLRPQTECVWQTGQHALRLPPVVSRVVLRIPMSPRRTLNVQMPDLRRSPFGGRRGIRHFSTEAGDTASVDGSPLADREDRRLTRLRYQTPGSDFEPVAGRRRKPGMKSDESDLSPPDSSEFSHPCRFRTNGRKRSCFESFLKSESIDARYEGGPDAQ